MSEQKMEVTASECIDNNVGVYAGYTISTKFPHVIDGLKYIARRILVVLHKHFVKEGPSLTKELSVIGEVVKMHPHGDGSIGEAISTLAQPFAHIAPLVFSDCNLGTYSGEPPAAPRYVDVAEADIARELFFKDINFDMFKMIPCESELGVEPAYLIPRIPTALLVKNFAIAIGYKTETFPMCVADLCKMTKEFIKLHSNNVDYIPKARSLLAKYTLPDFPTACVLRNSKQLIHAYKKGDYSVPVTMDGVMHVYKDRIMIETLPPDKPYKTIISNEGNICALQKTSWEYQNFQQINDYSGNGMPYGNCKCELRRGVNPFDVLATLKKKLQFTSNWKPDNRYVDSDGNMTIETPFTLIDKWYTVRYDAVLGDLKQQVKDMVDKRRRLLALIIICDDLDGVLNIFKNAEDDADTINKLVQRFKSQHLSRVQAAYLSTLKFSQMTKKGRADLLKELADLEQQMKIINEKVNKIPELMIESVEDFEKKFVNQPYKQAKMVFDLKRRCLIQKFIGAAIYRDNGYILVEDEKEFDQVLKDFNDPDEIEFKLFDTLALGNLTSIGHEEDFIGDIPKYIKSSYIDRLMDQKYTACICTKGGALIADGLIGKMDNMSMIKPISKKFIAVYKNGMCAIENVSEKFIRKNPGAGPTMRDVIYIEDNLGNDVVVIHGNSSQPNALVFERLDLSKGPCKLHKIPVGQWKIVAIVRASDYERVYLNVPKEIRLRCNTRHLVMDAVATMIKPGERKFCVFGRSPMKSDYDLVELRKKSSILLIKNHQ